MSAKNKPTSTTILRILMAVIAVIIILSMILSGMRF